MSSAKEYANAWIAALGGSARASADDERTALLASRALLCGARVQVTGATQAEAEALAARILEIAGPVVGHSQIEVSWTTPAERRQKGGTMGANPMPWGEYAPKPDTLQLARDLLAQLADATPIDRVALLAGALEALRQENDARALDLQQRIAALGKTVEVIGGIIDAWRVELGQ